MCGFYVVLWRCASWEIFGHIEEILVEKLDVKSVAGGLVEFGREVVDPCAAQAVGANCWSARHVGEEDRRSRQLIDLVRDALVKMGRLAKEQNDHKLPYEVRYYCMRSYSTASDPCSTTSRKVRPSATVLSLSLPAHLHQAEDPPIWKELYHPLRCSREKAQAELGSAFSPLGERTREQAERWTRLERVHPEAKSM